MSLFPVIDGEIVPGVPLELIASGAAAGVPLLIGTTRDEFRLFLVPTGVAGDVTAEALPVLAARYGWPQGVLETYAANRPAASPGDVVCAILTDAAFRAPTARLAAAHHAAGGTSRSTSSAGRRRWQGLGACHALELAFVFDTLATGAPMAGETAPQHLAEQMHRAWVAFGRDGDAGWQRWTPEHARRHDLRRRVRASSRVRGPTSSRSGRDTPPGSGQ